MRTRHLPLSMWLRHPIVSANATFLSQGAEHGELAHEVRGLTKATKLVHRRSRRMGRWSAKACTAAAAATASCRIAMAAENKTRILDGSHHTTAAKGWAITAGQARPLLAETLRRIDEEVSAGITAHHQSRSRLISAIAYLLLAVDAVALFTVFALLLNINWTSTPEVTTVVAFSLFGAGIQAKLALELGRRLWTWRVARTGGAVITWTAVPLFAVSACAGLSILLRVRHEGAQIDQAGLATALGLVLAGCAVVAPWIIVQQEAFDGSPLTRRAGSLTRVIARAGKENDRNLRLADRSLTRARRWEARLRREHTRVLARVARYYLPAHRAILLGRELAMTQPGPRAVPIRLPVDQSPLTTPLDQAHAALTTAEALRVGRPGLGLAGDDRVGQRRGRVGGGGGVGAPLGGPDDTGVDDLQPGDEGADPRAGARVRR
ncbi:hypothetical protein LV75_001147 [Actinokineospora diospyrosa]|uniref:Uncharacterized protein n=1 Tax=Actinokineospora diospyrosa TaxID=103728 RepID=A0ABT1I7Q2_9PSEU|nr:hypothetical protein [Actinokineospora diospyrosa]